MSNLYEISIDKIETDVMSILYANIDKKFTQYTLFNKLLADKYEGQYTNSIHPNFKSKYLLILRTLMSKYDDLNIEKKNGIYYIICLSSNENIQEKEFYNEEMINRIKLEKSDISNMYDYIYDNNLNEYMGWYDPFDGNSIFHELIINNNIKQTSRLLDENIFNFEIKNNQNQTPIDLINSPEMSNLIITEFVKKIKILTEKYNQEKSNVDNIVYSFNKKVDYYESVEYKNKIISDTSFYNFIMEKTRKYHFPIKMYFLTFIICYLAIKMVF
jgi:hypothetical protein